MNLRTTAGLLAIAAGLGLYVWLVEVRGEAHRVAVETAERTIVPVDADGITAMEFPLEEGRARIERRGEEWWLTAPVDFPANPATVDAALDAIARLESTSIIEGVDNPDAFGFGADAKLVEAFAGSEKYALFLGTATPVGSAHYVALSEKPESVYTIPDVKAGALNPELLFLRDRRVLRLDTTEVTALRLSSRGGLVAALERQDAAGASTSKWKMTAPVEGAADDAAVELLLAATSALLARDFDDAEDALEKHRFDRPDLEVELITPDATTSVRFAREAEAGFASADGIAAVYEFYPQFFESVKQTAFDYRDKRVLALQEGEVQRVRLEFPRDNVVRILERDGNGWKSDAGELAINADSVDGLLFILRDLQGTAFESRSNAGRLGLDPPAARVHIEDADGGEIGWLELGNPSTRGVPVRSSLASHIWIVDKRVGRAVPLSAEAFGNVILASEKAPADGS